MNTQNLSWPNLVWLNHWEQYLQVHIILTKYVFCTQQIHDQSVAAADYLRSNNDMRPINAAITDGRSSTVIPNYPHANINTGAIVGAWENITSEHRTQFTRSSSSPDANSDAQTPDESHTKPLLRSARSSSHHNVNQPISRNASMASKDLLFPSALMSNQTPLNSYKEHIDLNPNLCYGVTGFSNGQKKLCVQNTHVMPAISRGARSAIQVTYVFLAPLNRNQICKNFIYMLHMVHTMSNQQKKDSIPQIIIIVIDIIP